MTLSENSSIFFSFQNINLLLSLKTAARSVKACKVYCNVLHYQMEKTPIETTYYTVYKFRLDLIERCISHIRRLQCFISIGLSKGLSSRSAIHNVQKVLGVFSLARFVLFENSTEMPEH